MKPAIQTLLDSYPATAILGPRQCGKTTLAREIGGVYFDLEQDADQLRLDALWDRLLASGERLILDEAQQAPGVFPRLRGAIHQERKSMGRFLLLGSVSPALMKNVSESLAGRLALTELSPLLASELPAWGLPSSPRTTDRLMRMLAAVHGQTLNLSRLGGALGLDGKTVGSYLDYLEGAYLLRRLPPFFTNVRKRLVKSPKVYWRDSGLLHHLHGVREQEQLFSQPWVGHSWEGFVIEQTLATLATGLRPPPGWYFRTADGHELDLVLDHGTHRYAVEISLTSNPSPEAIARLRKTAAWVEATHMVLVCRIAEEIVAEDLVVTDLRGWLRRVVDLAAS